MELLEFFSEHTKAAVAFSGGVDSTYLLYAALKAGADVRPYCAVTPFQPAFELREAEENAKRSAQLRAELEVRLEKADVKSRREAERIISEARQTAEQVFA